MDLFINALLTGTPLAVLAALVGVIWQLFYTYSRDKLHDKQNERQLTLEKHKFSHQKKLEEIKFEYEQLRWRETLAQDLTIRLIEERIGEYTKVWLNIEEVAINRFADNNLDSVSTKRIAQKIKTWRYDKGGLLAEEFTRDVAFALQKALWDYDETESAYNRVRQARHLFLQSLRADIGIGKNLTGETIYESVEAQQKIREELKFLQAQLNIEPEKSKP